MLRLLTTSPKRSWAHVLLLFIQSFQVNAVQPKGWRGGSVFSSLPLSCRDFPRFTEYFDDIMGYRWWNPKRLCKWAFRKTFLNCWTICSFCVCVCCSRHTFVLPLWEPLSSCGFSLSTINPGMRASSSLAHSAHFYLRARASIDLSVGLFLFTRFIFH